MLVIHEILLLDSSLNVFAVLIAFSDLFLLTHHIFLPVSFQLPKLMITRRLAALSSLYVRTRWPASPKAGAATGRRTAQMARTNRQISVSMATWKQLLKPSLSKLVSSPLVFSPSCWFRAVNMITVFTFLRLLFASFILKCCHVTLWGTHWL